MGEIKTLIDKAAENVGGKAKLARMLDVHTSMVSMWLSGAKTCTPPDRARIAAIAGEDAVQELVRATLENASGRRLEQLQQALGKLQRQTGAVHGFALAVATSLGFWMTQGESYFRQCIERSTPKRALTVA